MADAASDESRSATGPPEPFLEVRDLQGPLPDRRRPGQGRRRAVVRARAGPDPRHRRRVRLGQERHQPGHHGPARRHATRRSSGEIWLDGAGARRRRRRSRCARLRGQQDGDDLPGPAVRDAPVLHGRRRRSSRRTGCTTTCRKQVAAQARDRDARTGSASRSPTGGWTTTRTSSPAACGSAR